MEKIHFRTVYEIGGSLGITIPYSFKNRKYLAHGTRVIVTETENTLIIETMNSESLEKVKNLGLESLINKNNKNQIILKESSINRTKNKNVRRGPKWQK